MAYVILSMMLLAPSALVLATLKQMIEPSPREVRAVARARRPQRD